MKKVVLLLMTPLFVLNACKKDGEDKKKVALENSSWVAIKKNGSSVDDESDKEYLFFSNNRLENYVDFNPSSPTDGCYDVHDTKFEIADGGNLKLTWDGTSENSTWGDGTLTTNNTYVINNDNTLQITFNYPNDYTSVILYKKTSINKESLKKCD